MKKSFCVLACVAALSMLASPARADLYDFDGRSVEVEYWAGLGYGNGNSSAMMVLDFGTASYAFGYTWTGNSTGLNLLNAVVSYTPPPAAFISYDSANNRIGSAAYDGESHISSSFEGFWLYYDSSDGLNWNLPAPGTTPANHQLQNLDWEGYAIGAGSFGNPADKPSTPLAPVPEPATAVLLALGGVVIAARRHFKKC